MTFLRGNSRAVGHWARDIVEDLLLSTELAKWQEGHLLRLHFPSLVQYLMMLELDAIVQLLVDEAVLLVEFLLLRLIVGAGEIHFELRHELLRRRGVSAPVVCIMALQLLGYVRLHVDRLLVGLRGLLVMGIAREDLLTNLWLVVLGYSVLMIGGPAMVVAEAATLERCLVSHLVLRGEATLLLKS